MNNTTKVIVGIIVIVLVIWGLSSLSEKDGTPNATNPIKIGVSLPLTGPIASAGEYAKQGVELAVRDLEKDGHKVEVFFEDNQYDSKGGISAYNKLRTTQNVDAMVAFGSPAVMPLIPIVNADQIPLLALTAAPAYSTPNDYTFRIIGTSDTEAKATSDVLVDQMGKKRIAVMYLNNDYGTGGLAAFKKYITGRATVVAEEGSQPGATDYRSQLTKIKAASPDGIFLITLYREAGTILKQAKEMGVAVQFMCGQPCDVPELFEVAGPAAEGLIVVAPINAAPAEFTDEYVNTYGKDFLSYITLRHYDAVKILASVSERCVEEDYSGECLRQQIDDLSNFPGLSYPITFDQNGDINDSFTIQVARNGKYVPYR